MNNATNISLALAIAARLTAAAHRAMQQDRDVTDEEMDAAMDRADRQHDRVEDLADRDNIDPEGNDDGE